MNVPKIKFTPYDGWDDVVGASFVRAIDDVVQVQNQYTDVIISRLSSADNLINNKITYNSFHGNIDALRPPK